MRSTVLLLLLTLLPVAAEDWTVDGRDYHNVTAGDVADGMVKITYDGGIGRVPLADLPPDLQKRFGYTKAASTPPAPDPAATVTPPSSAPSTTPPASTPATTPSADGDEKAAAQELQQELKAMYDSNSLNEAAWTALDAKIDNYQKQFGVTPQTAHNLVLLRRGQLKIARDYSGEDRFEALVMKIAADPQPEVSALTDRLALLKRKPLDLKFTALDGSAVDLAGLRGKVVLLDFWATWCPPCREEVPNVVAAYKKYHDKGFEIVGISLDQDKDALQGFIKDNGMVWPQYFDGAGWSNSISSSYGISSVPTMWLFDKKGFIAAFKARDDLDGEIQKALAAP